MVSKAKATLLTKRKPFYAVCAMRIKFVPITEDDPRSKHFQFQTMCTDGCSIFYNTKWTEKLTKEEVIGVIAHEVLHVVFLHGLRLLGRNPLLWNIAADFAINLILKEDNFTLPEGGCLDDKYTNWSADKIYSDLVNQLNEKNSPDEPEWGQFSEPTNEDGTPMSPAEKAELEMETKIMVQAAAEAAKSIGDLPGAIQEIVDEYTKSIVHWQDYLPTWLLGSQPDDYTWRKPNRKWLHGDPKIYMPSIDHRGSGHGALMIDTSGSVSSAELKRYLSEIIGIIDECRPETLVVVPCDTEVKRPFKWEKGDQLDSIEITGREGTRVTPAFEWVYENSDELINWCIYFTDLEVSDFPNEPPYPVLWLSTGKTTAPWGTIIKCSIQ